MPGLHAGLFAGGGRLACFFFARSHPHAETRFSNFKIASPHTLAQEKIWAWASVVSVLKLSSEQLSLRSAIAPLPGGEWGALRPQVKFCMHGRNSLQKKKKKEIRWKVTHLNTMGLYFIFSLLPRPVTTWPGKHCMCMRRFFMKFCETVIFCTLSRLRVSLISGWVYSLQLSQLQLTSGFLLMRVDIMSVCIKASFVSMQARQPISLTKGKIR